MITARAPSPGLHSSAAQGRCSLFKAPAAGLESEGTGASAPAPAARVGRRLTASLESRNFGNLRVLRAEPGPRPGMRAVPPTGPVCWLLIRQTVPRRLQAGRQSDSHRQSGRDSGTERQRDRHRAQPPVPCTRHLLPAAPCLEGTTPLPPVPRPRGSAPRQSLTPRAGTVRPDRWSRQPARCRCATAMERAAVAPAGRGRCVAGARRAARCGCPGGFKLVGRPVPCGGPRATLCGRKAAAGPACF
jgi:hypothetical protein